METTFVYDLGPYDRVADELVEATLHTGQHNRFMNLLFFGLAIEWEYVTISPTCCNAVGYPTEYLWDLWLEVRAMKRERGF